MKRRWLVLPCFRKLETDADMADQYHGQFGPMPIRRTAPGELVPIDHAFLAAARELGFPDDPDMNGPRSISTLCRWWHTSWRTSGSVTW